jgi:hypothetical protein
MAFPPTQHFWPSGQIHGVSTHYMCRLGGGGEDTRSSKFAVPPTICVPNLNTSKSTISGVPSPGGLPLVAGQSAVGELTDLRHQQRRLPAL